MDNFSKFIREASDKEKEEVYIKVMDRASQKQLDLFPKLTEAQRELRILYNYDKLAEGDMFPELFDEAFQRDWKMKEKIRKSEMKRVFDYWSQVYGE